MFIALAKNYAHIKIFSIAKGYHSWAAMPEGYYAAIMCVHSDITMHAPAPTDTQQWMCQYQHEIYISLYRMCASAPNPWFFFF